MIPVGLASSQLRRREKGSPMKMTSTLNDMPPLTSHERALLEALADQARLRARVAELEQARGRIESESNAKSESMAVIAHELRTPMSGLIGMTDLLLSTEVTGEQREYLEEMQSSARSLLQLLNDLLEYSKLEAGKLDTEPAQFPLRMTLHTIVHPLMYLASQKGLTLGYSVDFDVPDRLVGDPARLGQILVNLIGNAIKFTDSGEIRVNVERVGSDRKQACVKFTVSDTGVGITSDRIERIFEPYYQVRPAGSRRPGGIGLGLAIAARLAESLRGRIWVDSDPGKGSRFHFTAKFGLIEPVFRATAPCLTIG
jgi:two-component system sensor histidine kinase/response regulator